VKKYNPSEIEPKWQKIWEENANQWQAQDLSEKPKFYTLFEFPYPSGEGLHMGHLRAYTSVDVFARKKRLEGLNVMTPIGWDAFGLPTENYAIKNKIHPRVATEKNIASMKSQLKALGYFLDWPREINTTDPNYYKWTQWIFLQLFEHGLAYKKDMPINWCLSCKIGLANEEVIDGKCERCGSDTTKKNVSQWLLRITKYADKLIDALKNLDFPERVKTQQINWIGKSTGANIDFKIVKTDLSIRVFTTRADTLFGATFMVISPEHEVVNNLKNRISNIKIVEDYIKKAKATSDLERSDLSKEKTGVELEGIKAINPANEKEIPIFVADYVLSSYGTGAIMAVPAHDQRDYDFAKKHNLEIIEVISGGDVSKNAYTDIETGKLINSQGFDGLNPVEASKQIIKKLEENGSAQKAVNYKLRDWIFSRQHYWGEPIPIVNCEKCGIVPVPEKDLPVLLPEVENYEPTDTGESPLAKMTDWVNTKCPKCGGSAKRETDTMPNWAGSSWYFLAYAMRGNSKFETRNSKQELNVFSQCKKELDYWMPVDLYEGGMEHTTLHLLYSRFWNEFLHDIGAVPVSEPYKKRIAHGIVLAHDGRKMSKSFGNIVSPNEIIKKYGADSARAYIMFIGPFDQAVAWDENGLRGVWRFLNKTWANLTKPNGNSSPEIEDEIQRTIRKITTDIEYFSLNTAVAHLMEFNNRLSDEKEISLSVKSAYLKLLYPFAPHIAEELNELIESNKEIYKSSWPKADAKIALNKVNIVVSVNGRKRALIETDPGVSETALIEKIMESGMLSKHIKNGYKKSIYIKDRIINFVV